VKNPKDKKWMKVARAIADFGTCKRRKVGAVLVRDGHIVSTGYNGAPAGLEHCLEVGCEMEDGHCVRCVHAEANALIQAGLASSGKTRGATLYTTASPCRRCMELIINARVERIVYAEQYTSATHKGDKSAWAIEIADRLGIEMVFLKGKG
jgi:dCMP deaminase